MNGLGGLNKSPEAVVIGLVQLQLPVVITGEDLARQSNRIVAMVGKARRDGHQSRYHVPPRPQCLAPHPPRI
jgi:hypothetical protein